MWYFKKKCYPINRELLVNRDIYSSHIEIQHFYVGIGEVRKGFGSMDAAAKPPRMETRRPFLALPVSDYDLQAV